MPFSTELGMRVFDPLAAYASGQPAAAAASQAFENAPQRMAQMQAMRERAAENALRQEGLKRYQFRLQELTAAGKAPTDAAVEAYVENAHLFDPKGFHTALGRIDATEARESIAKANQEIARLKIDQATAALDAKRQAEDERFGILRERLGLMKENLELREKGMEQKLPEAYRARLSSLYSELRTTNRELEAFIKNNVVPIGKDPPREFKVLKNQQLRLEREIAKLTQGGAAPATAPAGAAPAAEPAAPVPSAPALPPGKVRVKDPQGRTGFIPADELTEALKQGFTELK